MITALRVLARPFRWLRDRFERTPVPQGWTAESLALMRPRWDEPLTGEIPIVDTAPVIVVDEHLGPLLVADMTPVRPVFYEQLRDVHPVNLAWTPSWVVAT